MHHSLLRPQSVPSFVRPLMASLALAFAAVVAQAAPVADVHALAQKEQQPLLDTLRDLVHIESGSKDIEGLNQIAERIASQLKQLGGTVDVLQTSDIYRLDDTPEKVGPAVQAVFKGTGSKKIMLIAHMDTVYLKGMLKGQPFSHRWRQGLWPGHLGRQAGHRAHHPHRGPAAKAEFQGLRHAHRADQRRRGNHLAWLAQHHHPCGG